MLSAYFTPLEFETFQLYWVCIGRPELKFTPLEFETPFGNQKRYLSKVKIYSVGVWNQKIDEKEKAKEAVKIYSVGVWNNTVGAVAADVAIG